MRDSVPEIRRERVQTGARGVALSRTARMAAGLFRAARAVVRPLFPCFALFLSTMAVAEDYVEINDDEAVQLGGASGGDIIRKIDKGNFVYDLVHIYTNTSVNGVLTLSNDKHIVKDSLQCLIVGGGGSGGADCGGGGGAGGLVYTNGFTLATGVANITVGAGGAQVVKATNRDGNDGANSVLTINGITWTAVGGGGGGCYSSKGGRAGGSGGGGYASTTYPGGLSTQAEQGYGIGFAGSDGNGTGGGGGGAGGTPAKSTVSKRGGVGGDGLKFNISGEDQFYAAGGGGGTDSRNESRPSGGSGVGGDGGTFQTGAYDGLPGKDGTGSGGGGACGGTQTSRVSGKGGDGIVVIRYTVDSDKCVVVDGQEVKYFGAASTNWVDGEFIISYTDTAYEGMLELPASMQAWVLAVGGGGAGANPGSIGATRGGAGGGGAGGYCELTNSLVAGVYSIGVGKGGISPSVQGIGGNGSNSVVRLAGTDVITAYGGGGGGLASVGNDGGSGGGGSVANGTTVAATRVGGNPKDSQGNKGGDGVYTSSTQRGRQAGGGGGGAGGAGFDAVAENVGGNGGDGKLSYISGAVDGVYYAGGGGGGTRANEDDVASTGGIGGKGGGGDGAYGTTATKNSASSGTNGLGGGGGGGCYDANANNPGGNGGSGIVIIRIVRAMPPKPVHPGQITFDNSEHIVASTNDPAFTVTGTSIATKTGTYEFTATLNPGYCWLDGSTESVTISWSIDKVRLVVTEFSLQGWQIGETPNKPHHVITDGEGETVVDLTDDQILFEYSASASGPWSAALPTTAGIWYVRATIPATADYDPPQTAPIAEFELWEPEDGAIDGLGYHAVITVTNYTGSTLTDFPMLVRIKEGAPTGFTYSQTAEGGSDIRFTDLDGNLIPHEIDEWNEDGTSLIWVKIPEYKLGNVAYIYWGATEGGTIPAALPSSDVWSDYIGVWHFNEESGSVRDATGHGLDAEAQNGGAGTSDGVVGKARENDANGYFKVPDYTTVTEPGALFTVSGWFKTSALGADARLVSHKNAADGDGWELFAKNSDNKVYISADGATNLGGPGVPVGDWIALTAVYQNNQAVLYVNDGTESYTLTGASAATVADRGLGIGNFANGSGTSFKGTYDEIHIRAGELSEDWILADWKQIHDGVSSFGHVNTSTNVVFVNRWIVEPTITPESWFLGNMPTITDGKSLYGAPYYTLTATDGTVFMNTVPTAPGAYAFRGVVDAGTDGAGNWGWATLTTAPITVTIMSASPSSDLSGTAGSATLSGRVLLANDDVNSTASISGQTIDLTTGDTFWVHGDEESITGSFPYLTDTTVHELCSGAPVDELCGATNIWRLENVRIGSTYLNGFAKPTAKNFLPYSPTMRGVKASARANQSEIKHLVMRNVEGAAIYSPCYTNGIGTIYFDAVNGWNKSYPQLSSEVDGAYHQIVVEVSRGVTTNLEDCIWVPVNAIVLKRDGTKTFEYDKTAMTIPLSIQTGGTDQNFYRIIVPFDGKVNTECRGPARFRIRRLTAAADLPIDYAAFILIDNIIASYPAMRADLEPMGLFDTTKGGKAVLGTEAAWTVPFPSAGATDVKPRAKATFKTNPGDLSADITKFITAATMNYRWRYLDQIIGEWKSVTLDPSAVTESSPFLGSPSTLEITNVVGDIEYWYDITLDAPFYSYVDYSGSGLNVNYRDNGGATATYSEMIQFVTNGCNSAGLLESRGTDWFVRLREGVSDWENFEIQYYTTRYADDDEAQAQATTNMAYSTVSMELIKDNVWRGNIQTVDPTNLHFRIVGRNFQTADANEFAFNEKFFEMGQSATNNWPISTTIVDGGSNSWHHIWADAATGYLMFQLDDSTKSLTLVHSDYQNINAWNDAVKADNSFVGSYTEDGKKSGASPRAKRHVEDFDDWGDMPATTELWQESFTLGGTTVDEGSYKTFQSAMTPNGWTAGQAMYVLEQFKDPSKGNYALQMEGCGRGYIDFIDAGQSPRGIGSLSFSTRLGQSIAFDDFAYYFGDNATSSTNYTFSSLVAFDLNNNKNFKGNASLSLIAFCRPGIGCYEYRIEPYKANTDKTWKTNTHIHSLHRWRYTNGGMRDTLLGSVTVENTEWQGAVSGAPTASSGYLPMYLSVSNDAVNKVTCIMAGFRTGATHGYNTTSISGSYRSICYRDATSLRLTRGTYGMLSANCEGIFQFPTVWDCAIPFANNFTDNNILNYYTTSTVTFPNASTHASTCNNTIVAEVEDGEIIDYGEWYVNPGRMRPYNGSLKDSTGSGLFGFTYNVDPQTITVYTAPKGTSNWTPLMSNVQVTGFGSSESKVFTPYSTEDCSIRIAVDGTVDDTRRDVVIDDIKISQWRGADWDTAEIPVLVPGWATENNLYGHTNFVFTQAWITNGTLLLSARRTSTNSVASIRSPLFDGAGSSKNPRGIGLGMFSFSYRNAQTNTVLHLQICTNSEEHPDNINNLNFNSLGDDGGIWETVKTFTFSDLTAEERRQGTRSHYLGMHGVEGLMRLVVDEDLVRNLKARNVTDPTAFGDIYITSVMCRDEPNLDESAWWGWNLRAVGPGADYRDTENRMYLPDLTVGSPDDAGLSLGLNNSATTDVDTTDGATYLANYPFVQTPAFGSLIVGEVQFRARMYDNGASARKGIVSLFGTKNPASATGWTWLKDFEITGNTYETFSYKTNPNENYAAFRFAVLGVEDIDSPLSGDGGTDYSNPARVLIDELLVSEAVRARVGFRNAGTFRFVDDHGYDFLGIVQDVPSENEQPLCGEDFGVQCEVYKAQLPDEIDFTRDVRVRLHWFEGKNPWGFENWRTNKNAQSGWLRLAEDATDSNLVFRTYYPASGGEIIYPKQPTPSGTVLQYALEVIYYQVGNDVAATNYLTAADWKTPAWYRPVDLNASSADGAFSAYTILDTVAPHWAWINEINLYGAWDTNGNNSDKAFQYVEVAVPAEANISGWRVEAIEADFEERTVITNTLGTFGDGNLSGTKPGLKGMASNMVFRVLGCPAAKTKGNLNVLDGTLDSAWNISVTGDALDKSAQMIWEWYPVGFRLVRSSGVVEHEVLTMGTNFWTGSSNEYLAEIYAPTNTLNYLNSMDDNAYIYPGDDAGGLTNSVSVIYNRGGATNDWMTTVGRTPGRINHGQQINPDHPTANGSSIIVYANLDQSGGGIYQTVGRYAQTNANQIIYVKKGSELGTNIVYNVDLWHQMGSLTTNGVNASWTETGTRTYTATVARGVSNNVTVIATAALRDDIESSIDDKRYRGAVIDWLKKRTDIYGNEWANADDETIYLADYIENPAGNFVTKLPLLAMYWLDMDPTIPNQALWAYWSAHTRLTNGNIRYSVFMDITNRTDDTASEFYGANWSPYVLRGMEPDSSSLDYYDDGTTIWTSETFKVTGLMNTDQLSLGNATWRNWMPLRWFVFHEDSFDENHTTHIEVSNPLEFGDWYDWVKEHGEPSQMYFKWAIDNRVKPMPIEILCPTNYYE